MQRKAIQKSIGTSLLKTEQHYIELWGAQKFGIETTTNGTDIH